MSFFARLFKISKAHTRARNTRAVLHSLTDHDLRDIGIKRGDIDYIADEPIRAMEAKDKYEAGDHYMRGKPVATWKGKAHA